MDPSGALASGRFLRCFGGLVRFGTIAGRLAACDGGPLIGRKQPTLLDGGIVIEAFREASDEVEVALVRLSMCSMVMAPKLASTRGVRAWRVIQSKSVQGL